MAKFKPLPPLEELRKLFDYNPETGTLQRIQDARGRGQGWSQGRYLCVSYKGRKLYVHRVAWYLQTGEDPLDNLVDHENLDTFDNRFSNLRLASTRENGFNRKASGVFFHPGINRYIARIWTGESHQYIGCFLTVEEAERAYREKAVELRGEFAPQEWRQGLRCRRWGICGS